MSDDFGLPEQTRVYLHTFGCENQQDFVDLDETHEKINYSLPTRPTLIRNIGRQPTPNIMKKIIKDSVLGKDDGSEEKKEVLKNDISMDKIRSLKKHKMLKN